MLTFRTDSNFYANARQVIVGSEGFRADIYPDSVKIPTIGYGYAMIIKSKDFLGNPIFKRSGFVADDFLAIGITLTEANDKSLDAIVADLNSGNKTAAAIKVEALDTQIRDISLSEAETLFNFSFDRAMEQVRDAFIRNLDVVRGDVLFRKMIGSTEMIALVDLAFNGGSGLIGPGLSNALWNEDRAEAWFEIRYNSNGGESSTVSGNGIAKRRYYESELFGLYEAAALDENQAKQIYAMYNRHHDAILNYEATYSSQIGKANRDFGLTGSSQKVQTLENSLQEAADLLKQLYVPEALRSTINPLDIQLATDQQTDLSGGKRDGYKNDTGQEQNDLLIGNEQKNVLNGLGGNDILVGGAGDDTLIGGTGSDTLIGGQGSDTYIYSQSDGVDTIIDSDGSGHIVWDLVNIQGDGGALSDQWKKFNTHVWQDQRNPQDPISYNLQTQTDGSQTLYIIKNGDVLKVDNWQPGDLGISLGTGAQPPAPLHTYNGDQRAPLIGSEIDPGTAPTDPGFNTYKWSATSWNNDGTLSNGIVEANFNDVITGSADTDKINGLGGNDALDGSAGNDQIDGGEGDDLIAGGAGSDIIHGGAGNDEILSATGLNVPQRKGLDDAWQTPAGRTVWTQGSTWGVAYNANNTYTIYGGGSLTLDNAPDVIYGDAGDDHVSGGRGDDYIDGGADNDVLWGSGGNDLIDGGTGNDAMYGDGVIESGFYSTTPAVIHGNDFLDGGIGSDWIVGGGKDDVLLGGTGNDFLWGDDKSETLLSGEYHGKDTLDGGDNDDVLVGGGNDDTLIGGGGNDVLQGDDAESNLAAQYHGNDYLDGGAGEDQLYGDGGNDMLLGGAENDTLNGGAGNDTLDGGAGADTLMGGANDDLYLNVTGEDTITDTEGHSTIQLTQANSVGAGGLTVANSGDQGQYRRLDIALDNGETLKLENAFFGTDATLEFANGNQLDLETLVGTSLTTALNLQLDDNGGKLYGGAGADRLYGGSGDDVLSGANGNDILYANDGNDMLAGGTDADNLYGGVGNDGLNGGAGGDLLQGEEGDDSLDGGTGIDILSGGAGNDTYFLDANSGGDIIVDSEGTNTIRLTGNLATTLAASLADVSVNPTLTLSANDVKIAGLNGTLGNYRFEFDDGTQLGLDEFLHNYRTDPLTLQGDNNGNTLYGGRADDTLNGNGGNDTLIGGRGNDTLDGGAGNDTYVFSTTSGHDVISWQNDEAIGDRIVFDTGIQYADLTISGLANGDLVISVNNQDASLTLKGWFNNASHPTQFHFQDGTVISQEDIAAWHIAPITGTAGADNLIGSDFDDVIKGLDGNDILNGGGGNDSLEGGLGRDTYMLQLGGGSLSNGLDTVTETGGETSVIKLTNADLGSLISQRSGNDLRLAILGGGEEGLLLKDYYSHTAEWNVVDYTGAEQSLAGVLTFNENRRANMDSMALLEEKYAADWRAAMIKNKANGATQLSDGRLELKPIVNFNYYQTQSTDLFGNVTASDESGSFHIEPWVITSFKRQTINSNDAEIYLDTLDSDFQYISNNALVDVALENWKLTNSSDNNAIRSPDEYVFRSYLFTLPPGTSGFDSSGYTVSPTDVPGQYLLTGYEFVPGNLTGYQQNTSIYGRTNVLSINSSVGAESEAVDLGHAALNHQPVPKNLTLSLNRLEQNISLTTLNAGDGDNDIYVRTTQDLRNIVHAGGGNDIIHVGVVTSLPSYQIPLGIFIDGGAGDDLIIGEINDDIIFGGSGNDALEGESGNDRYYLMSGDVGSDLIFDAVNEYVDEYGYGGNYGGSNDSNTVVFGEGVDLSKFTFSWGTYNYEDIKLYQTLDISWQANSVVRIAMPRADENGYSVKTGIQFFEFADGNRMTMAQMLALASSSPNILIGSAGNDFLEGGLGNDVLDGGFGNDTLMGRAGDDTYIVDNILDIVVEDINGGTDTIQASVTYTLGANVENLTLTGASALNASGNTDNNILTGNNAANTLDGATGADTLMGGNGDDTYLVDNILDMVVENANEGNDTVKSSITYTLVANFENLTLSGIETINGTGNTLDNILTGNSAANTLIGGAGNDRLDGGTGADTLQGGIGNDTYVVDVTTDVVTENANEGTDTVETDITYILGANVENLRLTGTTAVNGNGNALNNVLIGNVAANTLSGGASADTLIGSDGNDTYVVDNTLDVVTENLNEGTDLVKSSLSYTLGDNLENLTLTGSAAINSTGNALNNVLTGNSVANTLVGGAGNDKLAGGAGVDTMLGGIGDDTYVVENTLDVVTENLDEGNDLVQSNVTYALSANVENLILTGTTAINGTGNALDNVLTGNSAGNILVGDAGNDKLIGGTGADTLIGGTGNDTYVVDNILDAAVENLNEGIDLIQSNVTYALSDNVENLTLTGTAIINGTGNMLDNVLTGNSAANTLVGDAGNDKLIGGAGADTLIGGTGNDTYVVDAATDIVTENIGEGIDTVETGITYTLGANVENLTLTGTAARNGTGNTLDNTLIGNSAANTLSGGAGADTMIGGAGNDTYVVDNTLDAITENVNEGTDLVQSSVAYTLSANVENLTLTGTTTINATGNTLDNVLTGNSAANTLVGGAGNDRLVGGAGADILIGGIGNDTYVDVAADSVTENTNEGTDTVETSLTYTLSTNLENLTLTGTAARNGTGNALDNTLIGNTGINSLSGGAGNDTMDGLAGADTLTGGTGNDTYKFGLGYGTDTAIDTDATVGNTDVLSSLSGVANDQIWFQRTGNNLDVSIIGTNDKMTISNWYAGSANHIEQFKTADGKMLLDTQVDNLVSAMAQFAPPAAGQTTLPTN